MNRPKRSESLRKHGHAGGHLRDALIEALEYGDDWWRHVELDFYREDHNRWWAALSHANRARWLLGQLWNCRDTLASGYHAEITDRDPWGNHVFTYAALARLLAAELNEIRAAA